MMQLISCPERDPNEECSVRFNFISEEEARLYRLASVLKKKGFELQVMPAERITGWRCSAGKTFAPASESLNTLCLEMLYLADRFSVVFDGWQTDNPA